MQDCYLLPHLSVMEAMMVSANLKLPEKIGHGDKKIVVSIVKSIQQTCVCESWNIK